VCEVLSAGGIEATVAWTEARGHAEQLAREALAQGATRLVACGGDGTVHEVVNALMGQEAERRSALMLLPVGRCNDLATALQIPKPLKSAGESLLLATPRPIDVARVGDRYFTTVATLGFDSAVAEYVDRRGHPHFLKGTAAYLYGVLVNLRRYKDVSVRLKGDFGQFQGSLFMVATGNTHTYGGYLKITPDARIDDGLLDVCLVPSVSRWRVLQILPKVFSGQHVSHPVVSMHRTRRLEIDSDEPLWVWADGEPLCQTPTTIDIIPGALSVLVPPGSGFTSRVELGGMATGEA
jgi:diacylglycerol kinase (ATP)